MKIGEYEIIRELGEGGMGKVWLAIQPGTRRQVAVKTMAKESADDEFRERFLREARAAAKIEHPRVVGIYEVGRDEAGDLFMAMEYVDGGSLKDLLDNEDSGFLAPHEALEIITAAAEGLAVAERHHIVHRDIKPDNILISKTTGAKLADLGIARHLEGQHSLTLTGSSVTMGTPHYISPEQAMNASTADIRSDIYSLGATFYELVTGRPPFDGDTGMEVMMAHIQQPLQHPKSIRSDLPAGVCAVICKMLEKNPDNRYQNTGDLLDDLNIVADSSADIGALKASVIADSLVKAAPAKKAIKKAKPSPKIKVQKAKPRAPEQRQRDVQIAQGKARIDAKQKKVTRLVHVVIVLLAIGAVYLLVQSNGDGPPPPEVPEEEIVVDDHRFLEFHGDGDTVVIPVQGKFRESSALTIEFWCRQTKKSSYILDQFGVGGDRKDRGNWKFGIDGNGFPAIYYRLAVKDRYLVGKTNVMDGNWHHIAIVNDNGATSLYVDHVLSQSGTTTRFTGRNNLYIGSRANAESYYTGAIDELRVWNRALSAPEIARSSRTRPPPKAGLIGHWDFDDVSNNVVRDLSPSGLHGLFIRGENSGTTAVPEQAMDVDSWGMMCWSGKEWQFKDMNSTRHEFHADRLEVTNTTGIHRIAVPTYRQVLPHEFDLEIDAKAGYEVALVAADGSDRNFHVKTITDGDWHNYRFRRTAGKIDVWIDNKQKPLLCHNCAGLGAVRFGVSVGSNRKLELRGFRLEPDTRVIPSHPGTQDAEVVYLSDLGPVHVATYNVDNWGFGNKGFVGNGNARISVNGEKSPHGLGVHAHSNGASRVAYALDTGFSRIVGKAALNDLARGTLTPLTFQILGDDKALWTSSPVQAANVVQSFDVSVAGVKKLELLVHCPGPNHAASAVWFEPRLVPIEKTVGGEGPVLRYRFDKSSSVIQGRTGKWLRNEGKLAGDALMHGVTQKKMRVPSGREGIALYFDGDGDWIDCGNNEKLALSTFTIAMWVKWESNHPSHKYRTLVSKGAGGSGFLDNYLVYVLNDGQTVGARVGHGARLRREMDVRGWTVGDRKWHHIAFTFDSDPGHAALFVDGEIVALKRGNYPNAYCDSSNLFIGRWSHRGSVPYGDFHGAMYLFELYDHSLSAAQVKVLASRK